MKDFWKYFIVVLVLYLYIHDPYIYFGGMRMGSIKLLYIPTILLLITKSYKVKAFLKVFNTERNVFIIALGFIIIRTLLGGEPIYLWDWVGSFLEVMIVPCFIIRFMSSSGFGSFESMAKSLLVVGAVATVISMLCLSIPPVNDFVRINILHFTSDMRAFEHSFRGYGISESVSSQYGYVQGIMVVLGVMFIKSNRWFLYFLPFVLLSALVNARTGAIVAVLGIVLYLVYNKNYSYSLVIIAVSALFILNFDAVLDLIIPNEKTRYWIKDFIEQMDAVMDEGVEGSRQASTLFGHMFILPETTEEWIIGRGFNLRANDMGLDNSDVGFIQQLNYGGLIYVFILVGLIIYATRRLFVTKHKFFAFFFLLVFVIINIKTHYLLNSGAFRVMMLTYYMLLIYTKGTGYHRRLSVINN